MKQPIDIAHKVDWRDGSVLSRHRVGPPGQAQLVGTLLYEVACEVHLQIVTCAVVFLGASAGKQRKYGFTAAIVRTDDTIDDHGVAHPEKTRRLGRGRLSAGNDRQVLARQ